MSRVKLVRFDPMRCPNDRSKLTLRTWEQPALVRHGGYGETERVTMASCSMCGWSVERSREAIAPRSA